MQEWWFLLTSQVSTQQPTIKVDGQTAHLFSAFSTALRAPPPVRVMQSVPAPIRYCCWFSPSMYCLAGTYHHVLTLPDSTRRIQDSLQPLFARLSPDSLFHHISLSGHTTPPLLTAPGSSEEGSAPRNAVPQESSAPSDMLCQGTGSWAGGQWCESHRTEPWCMSTSLWMQ